MRQAGVARRSSGFIAVSCVVTTPSFIPSSLPKIILDNGFLKFPLVYFLWGVEPGLEVRWWARQRQGHCRTQAELLWATFQTVDQRGSSLSPTPTLGLRDESVSPWGNRVMGRVPPGHTALGPVCHSLPSHRRYTPLAWVPNHAKPIYLVTFSRLLPLPRTPHLPWQPPTLNVTFSVGPPLTTPLGKYPGTGYHLALALPAKAHSPGKRGPRGPWGLQAGF